MDDHRVRRDARRRREPAVALRGGNAPMLADVLLGEPVELRRRDPGLDVLAHEGDRVGDELTGAGHAVDLLS